MTAAPNRASSWASIRSLVVILVLLLIGAYITVLLSPRPAKPLLSSRSDDRYGAMALRLWLERSGYTVDDSIAIPADLNRADALFILEPQIIYSEEIAREVRDWVRRGNTLIVAGSPLSVGDLLGAFDVQISWLGDAAGTYIPGAPTLDQPPVESASESFPYGIVSDREDVVPHLFAGSTPILVSFSEGNGTVWVSGLLDPFTNIGIQGASNAQVILNLVAGIPSNARIAFDEGLYAFGSVASLSDWLFGTAPGIGVLGIVAITFVFLFLRGRRFGTPQPLIEEKLRREPVEYIRAIARLFRRAGGRDEMLRHYRTQLRRRLALRYGVDPDLPDAEFVRTLVYHDPALDEEALRDLLVRLSRSGVNEAYLLKTAADVDHLLRNLT